MFSISHCKSGSNRKWHKDFSRDFLVFMLAFGIMNLNQPGGVDPDASEQMRKSVRPDRESTFRKMQTVRVTERHDDRGRAPATAAIWTGLSGFNNRDGAASLLEPEFCPIFSLYLFVLVT